MGTNYKYVLYVCIAVVIVILYACMHDSGYEYM